MSPSWDANPDDATVQAQKKMFISQFEYIETIEKDMLKNYEDAKEKKLKVEAGIKSMLEHCNKCMEQSEKMLTEAKAKKETIKASLEKIDA